MANDLQTLQEKGLTVEEAEKVKNWIARGRPGLSRIKADFLSTIYNLGYSCLQIHQKFPEYELEAILWARVNFEWDKRRAEYQRDLKQTTLELATEAHAEGVQFLAMALKATHQKWRDEIVQWMAAPDREKAPEFLPKSMHQYMAIQAQLKELITPPASKGGQDAGPQVFINAPGAQVSSVNPKDVAQAMIAEMKKKKDE